MPEVTSVKTKSGTIIYAEGGDRTKRDKALDIFVKFYNRAFTFTEQRLIGNIWYNYKENKGKNLHGQVIAETGTFVGPDAKKYNPDKKKMVDVTFSKTVRRNEAVVVHEMIHARMFMEGIPGRKHNERMIDFEMVARLSRNGLKDTQGHYLGPSGNPYLAKLKVSNQEKGKIAREGILNDRRLLTGSLNTNIIGKIAVNRAKSLYPQSFFNQREF